MAKKEYIPPHPKPPLHWLILKGRRKLMPVVWKYVIPDLSKFKKHV